MLTNKKDFTKFLTHFPKTNISSQNFTEGSLKCDHL